MNMRIVQKRTLKACDDNWIEASLQFGERRLDMLAATDDEIHRRTEYMGSQAPDLTVEFLQKVYTENVMNVRHDIWDAHTDKDRWWVITSPTNLYSQEQFPNMDLALTFHVGLCLRIPRGEKQKLSDIPAEPFLECLRNLQEASDALGQAQEAGDYQSVGVRCREALLAFVAAAQVLVPWSGPGEPPQKANLKTWVEHICGIVLPGQRHKDRRHLFKTLMESAWQFSNWVTHTKSSKYYDAEAAFWVTENAIGLCISTVIGTSGVCPKNAPPETPDDSAISFVSAIAGSESISPNTGGFGSKLPDSSRSRIDAIRARTAQKKGVAAVQEGSRPFSFEHGDLLPQSENLQRIRSPFLRLQWRRPLPGPASAFRVNTHWLRLAVIAWFCPRRSRHCAGSANINREEYRLRDRSERHANVQNQQRPHIGSRESNQQGTQVEAAMDQIKRQLAAAVNIAPPASDSCLKASTESTSAAAAPSLSTQATQFGPAPGVKR